MTYKNISQPQVRKSLPLWFPKKMCGSLGYRSHTHSVSCSYILCQRAPSRVGKDWRNKVTHCSSQNTACCMRHLCSRPLQAGIIVLRDHILCHKPKRSSCIGESAWQRFRAACAISLFLQGQGFLTWLPDSIGTSANWDRKTRQLYSLCASN